MVGLEHSLKMSAPQLLGLGIYSVLKILNNRMTAPATPGLLTNGPTVQQRTSFSLSTNVNILGQRLIKVCHKVDFKDNANPQSGNSKVP